MEVHAHSHTERKKWTHYFWEFLMLFLAVFCGFLAENQREHMVEHQRAKVYASNLFNELKIDTTRLSHLIKWTHQLIKDMDTLCELSREKQPNIAKLYVYAKTTGSLDFFNTNCVTMEQLISSGNLRLMDPEISLNLSKYSKSIHDMDNDNSLIREEYEKISDLKLRIFDGYTLASLSPKLIRNARDSVFNLNLALLDDDPKLMRLFIGWVKVESGYYQGSIGAFLEPLLNKAKELLTLLNKKYHLE